MLPNFCLFISTSSDEEISNANLDKFLHERNSINILQNACVRNRCALEFVFKEKVTSNNTDKKVKRSHEYASQVLSDDSDEDSRSPQQISTTSTDTSSKTKQPFSHANIHYKLFFFTIIKNRIIISLRCKCIINGVKIASGQAKNKNDAKRIAALKTLRYLFQLFPAIKVNLLINILFSSFVL